MRDESNYLNIVTNLIDWPVIERQSEKRIGEVIDVAIHPTRGELTGIVIMTDEGEKAALRANAFHIHLPMKKVYANKSSLLPGSEIKESFKESVTIYKGLLGSGVVTRNGDLLGRVLSIYIEPAGRQVFYRVFALWAAVLMERGFYLAGRAPYFYSRVRRRLIVPVKTPTEYFLRSMIPRRHHLTELRIFSKTSS
jgi:sporulation protein YlmC with PRC-barrel domain